MKKEKISPRLWVTIILVGLSGQFAWTIENMYFNVFLYNTISTDPNFIATMVAASAIAATLATLLMGALSDRMGKRKAFVVVAISSGVSPPAHSVLLPLKMPQSFSPASMPRQALPLWS